MEQINNSLSVMHVSVNLQIGYQFNWNIRNLLTYTYFTEYGRRAELLCIVNGFPQDEQKPGETWS